MNNLQAVGCEVAPYCSGDNELEFEKALLSAGRRAGVTLAAKEEYTPDNDRIIALAAVYVLVKYLSLSSEREGEWSQGYNDKLKEFTDVYGEYDEATADLNTRHAWGEVDEAKTNFENASKAAREADEAVSSLSGDLGLFAAVADGTATDLQKFVTENANLAGGLAVSGQSFSAEMAGICIHPRKRLSPYPMMQSSWPPAGKVSSH